VGLLRHVYGNFSLHKLLLSHHIKTIYYHQISVLILKEDIMIVVHCIFFLLLITAGLFTISSSTTFIVGEAGTGKTKTLNHLTGSNFPVSGGIASCNSIQGNIYNNKSGVFDIEGFDAYKSHSKFDILVAIFDVLKEVGSIQNIVVRLSYMLLIRFALLLSDDCSTVDEGMHTGKII